LPALSNAHEAARRTLCQNNLKEIGIAITEADRNIIGKQGVNIGGPSIAPCNRKWTLKDRASASSSSLSTCGRRNFGWPYQILSYLGPTEDALAAMSDDDVRRFHHQAFYCPSATAGVRSIRNPNAFNISPDPEDTNRPSPLAAIDYAATFRASLTPPSAADPLVDGCGGPLPPEFAGAIASRYNVRLPDSQISASQTLMITERRLGLFLTEQEMPGEGQQLGYTGGAPCGDIVWDTVVYFPAGRGPNYTASANVSSSFRYATGSSHQGGQWGLYKDGHVGFLSYELDPNVAMKLATRRNEAIDAGDL
jgi:hypothetical protein